ncbi:NADP-dependent oxidoreductase [Tomitella fengzijianii]|uniref:NADP-dependent oxidoreductase n=1 Tax=Tomitella fengzijianii TaxID=2597660 RepID=A0A516X7A7_9ACTN|nr:NADP-dependent oxidoreductase [Tomitella fengzijianii]
MRAISYSAYGGPSVLTACRVPVPHAGPGQVRIAVRAASVNPFDLKKRSGMFAAGADAPQRPVIPGVEASGVIDEVGPGTTGAAVGDEVFGLGPASFAEHSVLEHWAARPAAWTWAQAASVSTAAEAAQRALDLLDVAEGTTLMIDGASGSVGFAAAQLALARGAAVLGTASPAKQERLRALGVGTVDHGLAERVAALDPGSVDAVLDASGRGSLDELIAIAGDPGRVVTLANFDAPEKGVRVSGKPTAFGALQQVAELAADGRFEVVVDSESPLDEAADAHARAEAGADGKVVVLPR